jgi:hypothetical protein
MDVFATSPIEGGTVRVLNHATNVALRFVVATLAEILVDGIRVKGVVHLLLVQGLQTADASKTGIPRDFHRAG